jgi:ribosomal protein S12 methylthiotransferase RimO
VTTKTKIGVVSLGCDKNRVDTETMLYKLLAAGYEITPDADAADVVIINTCAFIESSQREAVDTVLEFTAKKSERNLKVIVTGCLPERYKEELVKGFPDVDAFLGIADYDRIAEVVEGVMGGKRNAIFDCKDVPTTKRILTTMPHTAYLKIADGCDNHCTYCAIPSIRGKYRSRTIDGLIDEARELISEYGVKELNLVAQDITRYGIDLYNEYSLLKLLDKLTALEVSWVRLLYCYPELVGDDLIKYVAENDKICKYLDIPMQHINDRILKMMNRRVTGDDIKRLVDKIRETCPDIAIRSSFIVGFPTETEEDFESLYDFIADYKLDYAGFFAYSREDGTAAARLSGQVPARVKNARRKKIAELQSGIIYNNNAKFVGTTQIVLYEGIDYDKNLFYGRTSFCAPEVDGRVNFKASDLVEIGEFYNVKITGRDGYDLEGEVV